MDEYTWLEELRLMKFEITTVTPCLYYLMSDRPEGLELLTDLIENKTHYQDYQVEIVASHILGKSFSSLRMPFSGE